MTQSDSEIFGLVICFAGFVGGMGLLVLVTLVPYRRHRAQAIYREAAEAIDWRDGSQALAAVARLRDSPLREAHVLAELLEMQQLTIGGDSDGAARVAHLLRARWTRKACPWLMINEIVNVQVTGGRYGDALAMTEAIAHAASHGEAPPADVLGWSLVRINQAEALHCLGRDDEALALLRSTADAVDLPAISVAGVHCLRAWIRVHRRELAEGRVDLLCVDETALGPRWASEVDFTWAALAREEGRLDDALRDVGNGLDRVARASSERNGLLLLAGIHALKHQREEARACFERAVQHRYRGQGGDGLLRYAELLLRDGRGGEATDALALVVARDSESIFAARAREHLQALRERPT